MNRFRQRIDGGFFVIVFVAVRLISGDFPGGSVKIDLKFGKFILDGDLREFGLRRDFITKSYAIIENSKAQSKNASGTALFRQVKSVLGVIVGNKAVFTPGELNGFGVFGAALANEPEILAEQTFAADF